MEYIMEGGRARSTKGEQWGELWTVLFWESFTENASSPNLVFAVEWNIKQSSKLASVPGGKAGPATEQVCVDPELELWRRKSTSFITGKGRSYLQKRSPGVWCLSTCLARKPFLAIPSCSALQVRPEHFSTFLHLSWGALGVKQNL